jgi:hypothetical protein
MFIAPVDDPQAAGEITELSVGGVFNVTATLAVAEHPLLSVTVT